MPAQTRSRPTRATGWVIAVVVAAALAVTACATVPALPGQPVQVDPGLRPKVPANQIEQQVRTIVADNERRLGRSLAAFAIIRMHYTRAGSRLEIRHSDGSNPDQGALILDTDGWLVEAQGTFIEPSSDGQAPEVHGVRAFFGFDDDGSWSQGIVPCWTSVVLMEPLDGSCP